MADYYFSGQGIVYVADRDANGVVTKFADVGNVPRLTLSFNTDVFEHKESRTGNRLSDFRLTRENTATVNMTLEVFKKENLAIMLYGATQTLPTTAVTNESLGTGIVVDDILTIKKYPTSASGFTIVDSAGSPATLVNGNDYQVLSYDSGLVKFLNVTGFTQPLKANYTPVARTVVTAFKAPSKERFLRFSGLNTANGNAKITVDLYRIIFDPVANLDLINDELGQFELEGTALYDQTRDSDQYLGGFGRIILDT